MRRWKKKEEEEAILRRLQTEKARGFSTYGKSIILKHSDAKHMGFLKGPAGITCELENGRAGALIYPDEINNCFRKILNDVIAVKNSPNLNQNGDTLEPEPENDPISPWLKRNNLLLYGAPGTGKTVFVTELLHHLQHEIGKPLQEQKDAYASQLLEIEAKIKEVESGFGSEEDKLKKLQPLIKLRDEQTIEMKQFYRNNKVPPIIQINGERIKSAGGFDPNAMTITDMIVAVIEDRKQEYFGDKYSNEPYIVYFEEAESMGDVITRKPGRYLEELKNWLSTSQDQAGLRAKAQDPNSIIIASTNHYDELSEGVTRRERLGINLNFDWTPELLEQYGNEGGSNRAWPKINWPQDDLGWKFSGNANYAELYKMTAKFGYSKFKDKFVSKANQIIESYNNLSKEKREEKAKRELGNNIPTGKKEPTGQKNSDGTDKMKDVMTCNWLLHFLHTFHYYEGNKNLQNFTSVDQIKRYDFGNEFFAREEMQNIYKQLGAQVDQIGLVYDSVNRVNESLRNIKDLMIEAHNMRQEVTNLKANVTDLERMIQKVASDSSDNFRTLANQISTISSNISNNASSSNQSSTTSQLSSLNSLIRQLIDAVRAGKDATSYIIQIEKLI